MRFPFLIFLILISQFGFGQKEKDAKSIAFGYIDSLLVKDNYTVEFLDFEFSQDVQDILLRFQKNMAENKEWAEEYFSKNLKVGEPLPYHEKFGITKDEYQKIRDIENTPPSVVVKSTTKIQKIRYADVLSFASSENEGELFELLTIDFKNELVIFNNDTIPYSNEINAPITTPFGKWHGYSWKKEISNVGENDEVKLEKVVAKIIEVSFGRVFKNDKILFRVKFKDVDKGKVNANVDIACYLN